MVLNTLLAWRIAHSVPLASRCSPSSKGVIHTSVSYQPFVLGALGTLSIRHNDSSSPRWFFVCNI